MGGKVDVQMCICATEDWKAGAKREAEKRGISFSQLVRQAVEEMRERETGK